MPNYPRQTSLFHHPAVILLQCKHLIIGLMTKREEKTMRVINTMTTNPTDNRTDINNLCSRKLWEILTINQRLDRLEQESIEQELLTRRHYIPELVNWRQQTGKY